MPSLLPALPALLAQALPAPPSEHLGRPLGRDFELADWREISTYFERLDRESARVQTTRVGTTTEGRDFLLAVISSEENLARLDEIRALAHELADPRGSDEASRERALDRGRVVLFVSCAMHATECASPQMGMELAWNLATSDEEPWKSAREEVVVLLAPSLNPDGLDHVVEWYRQTVGTPYEASELLKLYQLYAGHDNNRDWFMLTQAETRLVTALLYERWFPQVYWDVHQQGTRGERMFVPPFRDPLNPNLDPAIMAGIDLLGTRALYDLTRSGYTGISTGVSYDMWWNGGNRNVPVRHNIVGLLTEAASARLATPIFLPRSELGAPSGLDSYAPSQRFLAPWPGGWWRIRDVMDYELAFARSIRASLARERRTWLEGALEAAERAIRAGREDAPRAWILPSDNRDPGAVERLVEVLLRSGVEVHASGAPLLADGREWPAGSLVVLRDQPYGAHAKDIFDVQRYPDDEAPYDIAGWTLPLLCGVHRVEVVHPLEAELEPVTDAALAVARFAPDPRLASAAAGSLSTRDSRAWKELVRCLAAAEAGQPAPRLRFESEDAAAGLLVAAGDDAVALALPRIGIYSPWEGSMDEGWTRWTCESFGLPYTTVRNEMLRAGALVGFLDVLVLPSLSPGTLDRGREEGSVPSSYTGGLDPEGAIAVEQFVRDGGTLVALAGSCEWVIDLLRLPLADEARGEDAGDFSCPGSVLRAIPEKHSLTADLPGSLAVFFASSSAWRVLDAEEAKKASLADPAQVEVLARYAPTRLLLSGWIRSGERIEGDAAWIRASHGAGRAHLFGFRPQFRGWTQQGFHLLLRALLLDGRAP